MKTLRLRVKDKHSRALNKMASEVNFIWNYINDLSHRSIVQKSKFLSAYEIDPQLKGAFEHFNLTQNTIKMICNQYVIRRNQFKKNQLKWRSYKYSPGWIPFDTQDIKFKNSKAVYRKQKYDLFSPEYLEGYDIRSGSFSQDAKGNWYLNVTVKVNQYQGAGKGQVGLDLGLKNTVTDSNGEGIEGRNFRKLEDKLAKQQRARNKKQVRNIHAKIKCKRLHEIHTYTTKLVKENKLVVIGNVKLESSKSVNDASWFKLKSILRYKCHWAKVDFREVNEAYSTVTCSSCGALTGPTGVEGLRIRSWICKSCNSSHDRDINAAKNILSFGVKSGPLVEEITLKTYT